MDIEFSENIDKYIDSELEKLPLHLRNNVLAETCRASAIKIIRNADLTDISPRELFVLGSKLRDMLKYSRAKQVWDYDTLSITPDDEERGGDKLYTVVNRIAREISSVWITGITPFPEQPVINALYRIDFCKSLLWLITLGLGVNLDLRDEYFK